jgi:hypothetical protein
MHLQHQQRLSVTLLMGLATLVAALAMAAMAATPGYSMPADAAGQVQQSRTAVTDVRSPDRQAPAPEPAVTDVRSPDRQAPAPEPAKVAFSGSASTTDTLGPEDGVAPTRAAVVQPGQPTWPENPSSLPAPASLSVSADSDGLELGSAALGAAGILGLGLLGLVAYAAVLRRRPASAGL